MDCFYIVNDKCKCITLGEDKIQYHDRNELYGMKANLNFLKNNIKKWLESIMSSVTTPIIDGKKPKKKYLELIETLLTLSIDSDDEDFEKIPLKGMVRDALYQSLSIDHEFSIPMLTDYIRKDDRFIYFNVKSQTKEIEEDFVENKVGGVLDIFRTSWAGSLLEFSCRCRDKERMLLWVMSSPYIESFKEGNTKEELEWIKKIEETIGVYL